MSLGHTKCDLSVVSDLKTVRTPCCCKQRRRASDIPLMYGRTGVDFGSVAGSVLAVGTLVFVMFFTNEYGYPLETRTDDKIKLYRYKTVKWVF